MMCFCHGTVKIIVHHRSICLVDHETFTPIFQNLVTCTLTLRKLQIYFRKCVKIYSNSTAHKTSERNLQKKFSKAIKRSETVKKKKTWGFCRTCVFAFFSCGGVLRLSAPLRSTSHNWDIVMQQKLLLDEFRKT